MLEKYKYINVFCPNCNTELENSMTVLDTNIFHCPNLECRKRYEQDGMTMWGEKIKLKEI